LMAVDDAQDVVPVRAVKEFAGVHWVPLLQARGEGDHLSGDYNRKRPSEQDRGLGGRSCGRTGSARLVVLLVVGGRVGGAGWLLRGGGFGLGTARGGNGDRARAQEGQGVDRVAVLVHFEVQVAAVGVAGATDLGDRLAAPHFVTLPHQEV